MSPVKSDYYEAKLIFTIAVLLAFFTMVIYGANPEKPVQETPKVFDLPPEGAVWNVSCTAPDELQFVDKDIRKAFEGKVYIIGTPTQVQLAREIRLLRIQMTVVSTNTVSASSSTNWIAKHIRRIPPRDTDMGKWRTEQK